MSDTRQAYMDLNCQVIIELSRNVVRDNKIRMIITSLRKSPCFWSSASIALSRIPPDVAPWPITKRMIMPFSSSNFFLFSPCGIQVARTESLLFLLLKAVLIPMTIRYLLLLDNSLILISSDTGALFLRDSWTALAEANSVSKFEIVLSRFLHSKYNYTYLASK